MFFAGYLICIFYMVDFSYLRAEFVIYDLSAEF